MAVREFRFRGAMGALSIAAVLAVGAVLPASDARAAFVVKKVAVECNGNCNDSTLGQICGSYWTPIAVDCSDVQEWSSTYACGGNNRCTSFYVSPSQALSNYCDDVNGTDANVYCLQQ